MPTNFKGQIKKHIYIHNIYINLLSKTFKKNIIDSLVSKPSAKSKFSKLIIFFKNIHVIHNNSKRLLQINTWVFQELCGWLVAYISEDRASDASTYSKGWPTTLALNLADRIHAKPAGNPCMCQRFSL